MGYAIAEALRDKGAIVTLISGPTHLSLPEGINVVKVESADDMFRCNRTLCETRYSD